MKRIIPSLLALLGSAVTAAGAYCALTFVFCIAWGRSSAHPIAIPVSAVGSLGCFSLFCLVAYFYVRLCSQQKRRWLILLDLGLYAISLSPFFHLLSIIAKYL